MSKEEWDETASAIDDDVRDMQEADLFVREWEIVGTTPPNKQSDPDIQHIAFYFQEKNESGDESDCSTPVQNMVYLPVTFNPSQPYQLELLPVLEKSLGRYYEYFKTFVSRDPKRDMLINLCKRGLKSPCFDVPHCYLADVTSYATKETPNVLKVDNRLCVPVMSNQLIESVIEDFSQLDIQVTLVNHDVFKYSTDRIRLSPTLTQSDIPVEDWRYNAPAHVTRITKCGAVATATFTVSMLLTTVYGPRSRYHYKKNLEIVIHAFK